jgi:hypothetical protein
MSARACTVTIAAAPHSALAIRNEFVIMTNPPLIHPAVLMGDLGFHHHPVTHAVGDNTEERDFLDSRLPSGACFLCNFHRRVHEQHHPAGA